MAAGVVTLAAGTLAACSNSSNSSSGNKKNFELDG